MPDNQEIRGNTLKAYLFLLKHGPSELREVQRGLDLSSASLASYHLGKLMEANYVNQDEQGRYFAVKDASTKVLEGYSKVGSAVVPQLFFFSLLFTILASFFSIEAFYGVRFTLYLIIVCIAMVAVFWYETVRLWRKLTP
jgi:DNA-binding transcriptional ArsR family regulator